MVKNQTVEERKRVCQHWLTYVAPTEFKGYVDDNHNRDLLLEYIRYSCNDYISLENLSEAAQHNRSNLRGVGVADTAEQKAAKVKAAADKAAAEAKVKIDAANQKTVVAWLASECPLGLIVNNDLYGSSQDKIVAFFRRNYPGLNIITPQILSEA